MKLLVLGATGPTGLEVVSQALQAGHEVTACVRNPAKIEAHGVRVVAGDAASATALERAVEGQEAVVSALGRRNSFKSDQLILRSMKALAPAMQKRGVRRLVLVSAFGVGESRRDAPPVPRLMYALLLRDIFADKKAAEDYLRTTRLDWTFVYPVMLTDGPRTGNYRAGERLELRGVPKISRADVAEFILAELRNPAYVRKTAVLSY
ncbi:MAG: NAD(P)-dependent oxidoreductase [Burkholderiales bacterium]